MNPSSADQRAAAAESVIDQTDRKTEHAVLDAAAIQQCYEEDDRRMGSGRQGATLVLPHPDAEPTAEQLSALSAVMKDATPFVDFAM